MRRTTAAIAGTFAGTALLTALKFGTAAQPAVTGVAAGGELPPGQGQAADPGAAADPGTGADPGGGTAPSASPSATRPGRKAPRAPGAEAGQAPGGTSTGQARPRPKPPATRRPGGTGGSAGGVSGTFTGAPSSNKFGTWRVTVTMAAGKLANVSTVYPTSPSKTAQINARAIPTLRSAALRAQSANVATVSGATYTSSSFRASLASALAAARR